MAALENTDKQLWLHLRFTMGKTEDFVLFCLHMTNAYSRESLQSFYVSSLTCRNTHSEDTSEKMFEACQETPNNQKDCLSSTQRPVESPSCCFLIDFDRFFSVLSLVDWYIATPTASVFAAEH